MMSTNRLKDVLKEVIKHLNEVIECAGTDGDMDYADMLQIEVDNCKNLLEILEGYANTPLSYNFLLDSLKQVAPDLDIEKVVRTIEETLSGISRNLDDQIIELGNKKTEIGVLGNFFSSSLTHLGMEHFNIEDKGESE